MTTSRPPCPVSELFDPLPEPYLADLYAVMASLPLAAAPVFFAPSIMSRWPGLRLVDGQVLTFHPSISLLGPQQLRVRQST